MLYDAIRLGFVKALKTTRETDLQKMLGLYEKHEASLDWCSPAKEMRVCFAELVAGVGHGRCPGVPST